MSQYSAFVQVLGRLLILSCSNRTAVGTGRSLPATRLARSWSSSPSTVWIVDHAMVVGAGIGGLAASLVLSRVAARVTLVERAERPSEVGAALALQPNGMAVLDRLGLLPAVEAVSARIDRLDIRSVTGRRLLTAQMPDLGGGLDHAIAVRRTDLHRLLLGAVGGVASVDTRFGCVAVSADPSGRVKITSTAKNGPDVDLEELRADVIVGADGVNSAVRSNGWLPEPGVIGKQLPTHDCDRSG